VRIIEQSYSEYVWRRSDAADGGVRRRF